MTPEEKAKRMEDLKKKRESVENELSAMETELSDEILSKKLGDLTVKEYLEVISGTNTCAMPAGGDMGEMMKASMDMLTKNPAMAKNLMKMFTGQRY
jgi:hypothetical protein